MAIVQLDRTILYWKDEVTGQGETVQFDAVLSLSPEDDVTITEHPVERGVNVTDHARDQPERLSIEAVVSLVANADLDEDAAMQQLNIQIYTRSRAGQQVIDLVIPSPPIQPDPSGLVQAGFGALSKALFGGPQATVSAPTDLTTLELHARALQLSTPRNRARDIYELLLSAKSQHALIGVGTRDREFSDMLIEHIAAPRSVEDGTATKFLVDLRRIHVADSETVLAPQPAEARGAKTQAKGGQTTEESPKAEQYQSFATALGGRKAIASLFGSPSPDGLGD